MRPKLHPGPDNGCPKRQRGGTALPGAKNGGGWVLAEGPGESAESTATAGSGRLTFEPSDSREAHSGLAGEFFLGQTPLTA
jgi:hypothetical protein